jgi:hypothetical protein
MAKSRKPRGPIVNPKALEGWKEGSADKEIVRLSFRFKILEELMQAGDLNNRFVALEALGALAGARLADRTEKTLKTCWPESWGDETLSVPLSLLLALRDGWVDYKNAPSGKNLGEAFKIEGGGQGARPMKVKLENIDRARGLANQVEKRYLQIEGERGAKTLHKVLTEVASEKKLSFETVKMAHEAHKRDIRLEMAALGLLERDRP